MRKSLLPSIFLMSIAFFGHGQTTVKILPNATTPTNGVFIGNGAGNATSTGGYNLLIGNNAGNSLTSGDLNTYIGSQAGEKSTTATQNVFIGQAAGYNSFSGYYNVMIGRTAGFDNTTGNSNVFLGMYAGGAASIGVPGVSNITGNNNTFIGFRAMPALSNLTNATAIGSNAVVGASNAIVLGNASVNVGIGVTTPRKKLEVNGEVIIGAGITTLSAGYNLYVANGILTEKVKVSPKTTWPDYVFDKEYSLLPIKDVENFIKQNNHLPDVPSSKSIEKNGLDLGEMDGILLKKIEELTLYIIQQKNEMDAIKQKLTLIESKVNR